MDKLKKFQTKVFSSISPVRKNRRAEPSNVNTRRCFIHVKYLSVAIAVVELSILLCQLLNGSWSNSEHAAILTSAAVLLLVVIFLLFVAIFYQMGNLLIPHIVMQTLLVLSFLGLTCTTLYALFHGAAFKLLLIVTNPQQAAKSMMSLPAPMITTNMVSGFLAGLLVLFAVTYLIIAIINTWCLYVVIDCYQLFKNQKNLPSRSPSIEEYCAPRTIQLSMYPNQIVQATDF